MVEKLELIRIRRLENTYQEGFKRVSITLYGKEPLRLAIIGPSSRAGPLASRAKPQPRSWNGTSRCGWRPWWRRGTWRLEEE